MIYNYIKCESIIAKVMADLNMSEKNVRITDIREWIFEAVDKIGAPMQYILKESGSDGEPILKIEDYQVPIPVGLLHLDAVAYAKSAEGIWAPMRTSTASFKSKTKCNCNTSSSTSSSSSSSCSSDTTESTDTSASSNTTTDTTTSNEVYRNNYTVPCLHGDDHDGFLDIKIRCQADLYTINGVKYMEKYRSTLVEDLTYFIKPGWIVTNQKTGYIKLAYKTIAVDERGYPLVPDLSSYQEAVYWYVVMKLSFPKYLSGRLGGKGVNSSQNTFFYIQQQWNFYRNQAYAECMMPTAGDMESIKNDWNKLLPKINEEDSFFENQGNEQIIYNDYYYGY